MKQQKTITNSNYLKTECGNMLGIEVLLDYYKKQEL